jgi:hypothetical protein
MHVVSSCCIPWAYLVTLKSEDTKHDGAEGFCGVLHVARYRCSASKRQLRDVVHCLCECPCLPGAAATRNSAVLCPFWAQRMPLVPCALAAFSPDGAAAHLLLLPFLLDPARLCGPRSLGCTWCQRSCAPKQYGYVETWGHPLVSATLAARCHSVHVCRGGRPGPPPVLSADAPARSRCSLFRKGCSMFLHSSVPSMSWPLRYCARRHGVSLGDSRRACRVTLPCQRNGTRITSDMAANEAHPGVLPVWNISAAPYVSMRDGEV